MGDAPHDRDQHLGNVAREARLAQALRDNLKRRKAQTRARAADSKPAIRPEE